MSLYHHVIVTANCCHKWCVASVLHCCGHCMLLSCLCCVGECFFWYWLTRVVPDKGPLTGCVCVLMLCISFFQYRAKILAGKNVYEMTYFVSSVT